MKKIDLALKLARVGLPVIPVKDGKPLIENWMGIVRTDFMDAVGYWFKWPDADIGLVWHDEIIIPSWPDLTKEHLQKLYKKNDLTEEFIEEINASYLIKKCFWSIQ